MIVLKKKPEATKCSIHCTVSLNTQTAKIVVRILRRGIERKIEDVLQDDQFECRRRNGTRDAIGILTVILKQTLEIDEELYEYACFIDWQKIFDGAEWTKLMQILKETGELILTGMKED
jgi:hypothetical protein